MAGTAGPDGGPVQARAPGGAGSAHPCGRRGDEGWLLLLVLLALASPLIYDAGRWLQHLAGGG